MLYKIQFRICCPFDSLGILPPQESRFVAASSRAKLLFSHRRHPVAAAAR